MSFGTQEAHESEVVYAWYTHVRDSNPNKEVFYSKIHDSEQKILASPVISNAKS